MLVGPNDPFFLLALCSACGYDRDRPIPFVAWLRWHHAFLLPRATA